MNTLYRFKSKHDYGNVDNCVYPGLPKLAWFADVCFDPSLLKYVVVLRRVRGKEIDMCKSEIDSKSLASAMKHCRKAIKESRG